jgi:DNA-3-methyladenine glycosylase II
MTETSLQYDPAEAVRALRAADPTLAGLMDRAGPFALHPERMRHSPFDTLLRAIIYQQLSTKAAESIHERVLALFPEGARPTPRTLLTIDPEALRAAGMSKSKVASARDLAEKTVQGVVPDVESLREMADEAIVERLTAVRGIGRWTVEMLLIARLGRPDVFPVHDLGIRRGYMITYGLGEMPTPRALEPLGDVWRPYRSVASWYLWRAVHLSRGEP